MRRLIAIVGLVLLVILPTPGTADGVSRDLEMGLSEDYQEDRTTDTDLREDMRRLRDAGTDRLRFALAWDGTHTGPGEFDFSFWDRLVSVAEDYDVDLIPYLGYTPRWLADGPDTGYWTRPPENYEQFGQFVERTARRYRGRIHSWEIWNEPDNPDYWTGSDTEFARLVKVASKALDRVEGDKTLVLGGIAWDVGFLRRQFRRHDVERWVDVVNAHAYYETWHSAPLERLPRYLNRIQSVIDRHGDGEELWMAEVGYSNYRNEAGRVSDVYRSLYEYEHTEWHQAVYLFRTMTLLQTQEDVELVAWYRLNDLPSDEPVIGDENNRYLGIYGEEGEPKPSRDAFRFATEFFEGSIRPAETVVVEKVSSARREPRVHPFTNEDDEILIVTWFPNRYEESDGKEPFPRRDDREGSPRLYLTESGRYELTEYDVTGTIADTRSFIVREGRHRLKLPVRAGGIGIYRLSGSRTNSSSGR